MQCGVIVAAKRLGPGVGNILKKRWKVFQVSNGVNAKQIFRPGFRLISGDKISFVESAKTGENVGSDPIPDAFNNWNRCAK